MDNYKDTDQLQLLQKPKSKCLISCNNRALFLFLKEVSHADPAAFQN